jgi:hypothetical protein
MNNKIDWRNHIIELIVVFIGITLAFMLNNWRENNTNQVLAEKYMTSFRDDIAYDQTHLDSIISSNEIKLKRVKTFIRSLKNKETSIKDAEEVIGIMAELNPFIPKVNTYESIKNSGNLNLISEFDIRKKLIQYYQSFEEKKLLEQINMQYLHDYIIPFIHQHVDFLHQKMISQSILKNHHFSNLVLGYYQMLIQLIDNYKGIYQLNKELELLMEKQ